MQATKETTISLGDGPAVPMSVMREALDALEAMKPPPRFTKVKYDGEQVELRWITERKRADGKPEYINHTLTCKDAPAREFVLAMGAFLGEVVDLLELPDSYESNMRVTGLALNYDEKDGRMGVVITALKGLSTTNAPLVLNTPHLAEEGEGDACFMPEHWGDLIHALAVEAKRYIDGHRSQGDLFA